MTEQTIASQTFLGIAEALAVMEAAQPEGWGDKVTQKLPPEWIKTRKGPGGTDLEYIEGHRVIELLAEASGRRFSFLVLHSYIQPSYGRQLVVRNQKGYRDPVMEVDCPSCGKPFRYVKGYNVQQIQCMHCKTQLPASLYPGTPVLEPQPPIAHVLGMLIVPGVGAVSQWGSKVLLGGADEQESAFKAAATDAFKKCATLLGIGLELYDKDEDDKDEDKAIGPVPMPSYAPPAPMPSVPTQPAPAPQATAPQPQPAAPASVPAAATPELADWPQDQVERMKDLREKLGIPADNRAALNPLVSAWSGGKLTSYNQITPANIKEFCDYMESLLQGAEVAN